MSTPYNEQQQAPQYGYPQQPVQQQKGAGLAITSLVLGIVALFLSWIPFVNYIAVILGVVGLVLGVVGIWKSKRVMSIIGSAICLLAIIVSFVAFGSFVNEVDKSIQELENSQPE
jgi:hypothetical protein